MIWICYRDKFFCSLFQVFSVEIYYAIFCSNIMLVRPGGGYPGTSFVKRYNLLNSVFVDRRHSDNGLATFRKCSAPCELPTYAKAIDGLGASSGCATEVVLFESSTFVMESPCPYIFKPWFKILILES